MRRSFSLCLLPLFLTLAALANEPTSKLDKLSPRLSLNRNQFDFGSVEEGIDIACSFLIKNVGSKVLKIKAVKSSCGCTVPVMKSKTIAPGCSEELKVVMDTSMKQGPVDKEIEIISNDPSTPHLQIHVKATVADPHANLGSDKVAKIFTGRCAACHVQLGEGKLGEDLYMADCAMCHGFNSKGGVGPCLFRANYKDAQVALRTKQIIERGSSTHRSMPGFSKGYGGPLNNDQIKSLMEYLNWRAEFERGTRK